MSADCCQLRPLFGHGIGLLPRLKSFGIGIESRFIVQSAHLKPAQVFFLADNSLWIPTVVSRNCLSRRRRSTDESTRVEPQAFCHRIDSLASRREASDGHKGMTASQYVCSSSNEMSSSLEEYGKRKGPDFVSGPFRLNDWRNLLEL